MMSPPPITVSTVRDRYGDPVIAVNGRPVGMAMARATIDGALAWLTTVRADDLIVALEPSRSPALVRLAGRDGRPAFGAELDALMQARTMRRARMAELIGADLSYLSRLIRGERQPSTEMVLAMASALDSVRPLTALERRRLFLSAGHLPPGVTVVQLLDDRLAGVLELLATADQATSDRVMAALGAIVAGEDRRLGQAAD